MLTQYKLTLQPEKPCSPRPEWAYRLYAALLAETSQDFAVSVHQSAVTPVSQFLRHTPQGLQWTINLLGEESEAVLAPVIDRLDRVLLEKDRVVCSAVRTSYLPLLRRGTPSCIDCAFAHQPVSKAWGSIFLCPRRV